MRSQSQILSEGWVSDYEVCETFGDPWGACVGGNSDWPEGYKVLEGKLYHQERLCVPTGLIWEVLRTHHDWVAHVGNDRLLPEILRRYELPAGYDIRGLLAEIRRSCLVCQACDRPNWSMKRPIAMTPIPDRFMASVCLDVFHMPRVDWLGQSYDAFLLCVDRHSGWMLARPTMDCGLTGEKAAHLMLDSTWGEVGVPSVMTSDRGSQFLSGWWLTMCSRLGIRTAYSQAHHHQANGRAEVAGRVLQDILRKLLIEEDVNWVAALPRALRIHHDMVDPVTNLSPYEIVFGRERSLAGLPWSPVRWCSEAESFFDAMRDIDEKVAKLLNEEHAKVARRVNANRGPGPVYHIGDWVWYLRPKSVGGTKLRTYWQGPFKVLSRAGERSYRLRTPQGEEFDAFQDQLKPCCWDDVGPVMAKFQYPVRKSADHPMGVDPGRPESDQGHCLAPAPRLSQDSGGGAVAGGDPLGEHSAMVAMLGKTSMDGGVGAEPAPLSRGVEGTPPLRGISGSWPLVPNLEALAGA